MRNNSHTGILPVLVRSPWVVAMGAATVDEVSGGPFNIVTGLLMTVPLYGCGRSPISCGALSAESR